MNEKTHKSPVTAAVRMLRQHNVAFVEHLYTYRDKGGTSAVSEALGVEEHNVIKTLVMEADGNRPLVILMHGDCSVSTKELARVIHAKRTAPCDPASAEKYSGYLIGGTSPFGTRTEMEVLVEASILELDRIYINGGHRGFILEMVPAVLVDVLAAVPVNVAVSA